MGEVYGTGECIISLNSKQIATATIEAIEDGEVLGVTGTLEEMMSLESKIAQIKDKAYSREILRANESNEIYRKFRAKADNTILIGRDLA